MGAAEEDWQAMDIERPQHQVTLSDYYVGETEVTQELWETIMGYNPSKSFKGGDYPVEYVDWNDCQEFIAQLNELTEGRRPDGRVFRLPTEAEWEFAARGGNKSKRYLFSGGELCQEIAWFNKNCIHTKKVKTKKANELGLYDMNGNVAEWCHDWWSEYKTQKETNPQGPSDGGYHVYRGGCWALSEDCLRNTYRNIIIPFNGDYHNQFTGFRLAL